MTTANKVYCIFNDHIKDGVIVSRKILEEYVDYGTARTMVDFCYMDAKLHGFDVQKAENEVLFRTNGALTQKIYFK